MPKFRVETLPHLVDVEDEDLEFPVVVFILGSPPLWGSLFTIFLVAIASEKIVIITST